MLRTCRACRNLYEQSSAWPSPNLCPPCAGAVVVRASGTTTPPRSAPSGPATAPATRAGAAMAGGALRTHRLVSGGPRTFCGLYPNHPGSAALARPGDDPSCKNCRRFSGIDPMPAHSWRPVERFETVPDHPPGWPWSPELAAHLARGYMVRWAFDPVEIVVTAGADGKLP